MSNTGRTDSREPAGTSGTPAPPDGTEEESLQSRVAVLEAENRRLREEYARTQQASYRRTALGLLLVGTIGLIGGIVFPDARTVLFALGGTGVFAGVLTYVITPERFISVRVGTRVFQALRADRDAVIDELGLQGDPVYVPVDEVRLFVPRKRGYPIPDAADLANLFVVPTDSQHGGVSFRPTGEPLFEEFETATDQSVTSDLQTITPAIADALVELFELADGIDHGVDTDTERITFELTGLALGDPTSIDHPVPSFLAVSLARTLETPITVGIADDDPLVITCQYNDVYAGRAVESSPEQ